MPASRAPLKTRKKSEPSPTCRRCAIEIKEQFQADINVGVSIENKEAFGRARHGAQASLKNKQEIGPHKARGARKPSWKTNKN